MVDKTVQKILNMIDQEYGLEKDGFLHNADWQLLMAIMLSAQSTDKQVHEVLPSLWKKFPTLQSLVDTPIEEVEDAIRRIGLYKNKAKNMKLCCQQLLVKYDGKVPMELSEIITLAGVGRKTATLFLADAYGIPGVTVDTHVFRISKRLGWAKGNNPIVVEKELMKCLPEEHWNRINFQLIFHGRAICTARKAHCEKCAFAQLCPKVDVKK